MPEPAWMCLYKQDSEYALGPKCVKILNMAKFWIRRGSQCERYAAYFICQKMPWQSSESWVLNIPLFWIWQGSEYARVTQISKYTTKWLNISGREYVQIYLNLL